MTEIKKGELENAISVLRDTSDAYFAVQRSVAHYGAGHFGRTFDNVDSNISVRSEYNRSDYDYFRYWESTPDSPRGIIAQCMKAYERVSIVRNVIDMMSDFTSHGIRIFHPNKRTQNFFDNWAEIVNFKLFSERIANTFYRCGLCPVRIKYGRVPVYFEEDLKRKAKALSDDIIVQKQKVDYRRIPLAYNIFNPLSLEIIGGDLAAFVGNPIYGLKVSMHLKTMLQQMEMKAVQDENIRNMLKVIPDELKVAIKGGRPIVPLEQEKIRVVFYKKDDWKIWPTPMLAAILDNLSMLEKMHLADKSALDGAISHVRLWRLGIWNDSNPHLSILPNRAQLQKLQEILQKLGNGGGIDFVWGPELDFKESSTSVHQFLGSEKYTQVMSEIYMGLGVPATLTGGLSKGSNQGFTNNAISMRTLIERLEHGRNILKKFWDEQFVLIQKAMKWRVPARIVFDNKVLADDSVQTAILKDMWDRHILSTKTFQEITGRDPQIEDIRISREVKDIDMGRRPEKAGPYHQAEKEHEYKKLILQSGGYAPSEIGLELEEKNPNEETPMEFKSKLEQTKIKSPGGDGRPKNSFDKSPRKQRTPKPKQSLGSFVNLFIWANQTQAQLNELFSPFILNHFNKKNLRSLSREEFNQFEAIKFRVLTAIQPYSQINEKLVYQLLKDNEIVEDIVTNYEALAIKFTQVNNRKPTVEEIRQIQSSAYALEYEQIFNI